MLHTFMERKSVFVYAKERGRLNGADAACKRLAGMLQSKKSEGVCLVLSETDGSKTLKRVISVGSVITLPNNMMSRKLAFFFFRYPSEIVRGLSIIMLGLRGTLGGCSVFMVGLYSTT